MTDLQQTLDSLSSLEVEVISSFNSEDDFGLSTHYSFAGLQDRMESESDINLIIAVVRTLRARGLLQYKRGLFTEEGTTFGSGYGLTAEGKQLWRYIHADHQMIRRRNHPLNVLAEIARAYHNNELDGEARKFWGRSREFENDRDPATIELYTGRGGKRLLTLADCLLALDIVEGKVK